MKRLPAALAAAILVASALALTGPANAAPAQQRARSTSSGTPEAVNGRKVVTTLRAGIRSLHTAYPRRAGYVRSKFRTWDDADHDCRDTRAEVLQSESKGKVRGGCTILRGSWRPYYDAHTYHSASSLDIDHLVPLAEAWASGARWWSSAKREAYANDLTDPRTLIAVSAHDNRSKGDRDPAFWLPSHAKCTYVTQWTAVKIRWGLSANEGEKRAVQDVARRCGRRRIVVHKARVVFAAAPHKHHSGGTSGATGGGGGCTHTSSGSCIRAGEFCKQADYGHTGRDASGNMLVCTGDRTHPRWKRR
ncbi:HNH endonuclease family protein [Nocardioides terrisoli]|uniref:HNH endonuclease family protein n=1 Tax=Nocardioides terrisoli TaxID=3388267 RepID=UPI00287B6632|nr:HNH endonuclease family protein [Nocardioides marmorisolisilvae]